MPEKNGQSDPSKPLSDLDQFEAKLDAARVRRDGKTKKKDETDNSLLGMAWRLSTELLAAVFVGWFLGWLFDYFVGTQPWGSIVGLGLGIAAGFLSVFRTAAAMEAKTAHISKGEDMPPSDDDN